MFTRLFGRMQAVPRAGAASTRNPVRQEFWRRSVALIVGTAFTLLAQFSISVIAMLQDEEHRVTGRTALLATAPSPNDLFLLERDDKWRGEQFEVFWMDPAGDANPVLPPGMEQLPSPGQAVVSPGLERLASRNPILAAHYPDRLVLGPEGVQNAGELLAYVRLPEGRTLAGNELAWRVRAFNPSHGERAYPLDPISPSPPVRTATAGVLVFLVFPGLILLIVAITVARRVPRVYLDVPPSESPHNPTARVLAWLEVLKLMIPGVIVAAVFWAFVSPRLQQVPLVGYSIFRGELELPWWVLFAVAFGCIATIALLSASVAATRFWRVTDPVSAMLLYASPISIAIAVFALSAPSSITTVAALILGGIIAIVVVIPAVSRNVMRVIGARLSRSETASTITVGQHLNQHPYRTALPFFGVASLIIVALASGAIMALRSQVDVPSWVSSSRSSQVQVAFVEWLEPESGDATKFGDAVGAGLVLPLGAGGHEHESGGGHNHQADSENGLAVGTTCSRLATYFPGTRCKRGAPYELPEWTEQRLAETLALAHHGTGEHVRLVPENDEVVGGGALAVIADEPLQRLETRTREAAMETLPAPHVYSASSFVRRYSPLVIWIAAGILIALVLLTIGYLLWLVAYFAETDKNRRSLPYASNYTGRQETLKAWQFAIPYGTLGCIGSLAGVVICGQLSRLFSSPMPWSETGVTLLVAAIVGIVGTAANFKFGRNAQKRRRREEEPLPSS